MEPIWSRDNIFGTHTPESSPVLFSGLFRSCVGCMIEAVRSAHKTIDIDNVNRVLMQPHWQTQVDLTDFELHSSRPIPGAHDDQPGTKP